MAHIQNGFIGALKMTIQDEKRRMGQRLAQNVVTALKNKGLTGLLPGLAVGGKLCGGGLGAGEIFRRKRLRVVLASFGVLSRAVGHRRGIAPLACHPCAGSNLCGLHAVIGVGGPGWRMDGFDTGREQLNAGIQRG